MPRKNRIDAPGAIHHIVIRGIERSDIFRDKKDYENFLNRLGSLLKETSTPCYAWALMRNHAHLLTRSGLFPLSSLMRRLLTGYARQFNRRYNRSGHLFQNRYKSVLCEEEPYLLELVRYIHLNPIRAGAVEDMTALKRYPWSGHAALMGRKENEWQDVQFVLNLFHGKQSAYASFVEKGIAKGPRPDLMGGGLLRSSGGWVAVQSLKRSKERFSSDERILGGTEFVTSVLKRSGEERAMRGHNDLDMERLIAVVCTRADIDPGLLRSPVKVSRVSRIRSVIAHIAFDIMRLKGVTIAKRLSVSPSAISKLVQRGRGDALSRDIEKVLCE